MKRILKVLAAAVFVSLFIAGTALATATLDFSIEKPANGSISYAGGLAPLVGTNISVDNVTLSDESHAVDKVFNGMLNFTTGAADWTWSWGGGTDSSITLVGGVDTNHDGIYNPDKGDIPMGTTLLTGRFGSASVYYDHGQFLMSVASFTDVKDADLLTHFNLPVGIEYAGNFNISFIADFSIWEAFTSGQVVEGGVNNSVPVAVPAVATAIATVPEPATMLLLGLGLIGVVGVRKHSRINPAPAGIIPMGY